MRNESDRAPSIRGVSAIRGLLAIVILYGLASGLTAVHAESLPSPQGETILTITGRIGNTNGEGAARFDLAMLEGLPQTTTKTTSPWNEEPAVYQGVLARDLMKLVDAEGTVVTATALNDYETDIPLSDFDDYDVIIAIRRNGEYMPVRDKGPLFVIYPFDADRSLWREEIYQRSIWQLKELTVQ